MTEKCESDTCSVDIEDATEDKENDSSSEEEKVLSKKSRVSVTEQHTMEQMELRNKVEAREVEDARDIFPEVPVRHSFKTFNPDILEVGICLPNPS